MDSGKVYMIVGGQLAMVPREHAEKIQKKEMLAARAMELKTYINKLSEVGAQRQADVAGLELKEIMGKIIRLNRRIPACVQTV